MNHHFFKIAMARLGLLRPTTRTRELGKLLSEVTGVPLMKLLATEQRVRALQSFTPLKDLLDAQDRKHRDAFKWWINVRQLKRGEHTPHEEVASQYHLTVKTVRGVVEIVARIDTTRRLLPIARAQESARIVMFYRISAGAGKPTLFQQTLALSDDKERGKPVMDRPRRWVAGIIPRTQHV